MLVKVLCESYKVFRDYAIHDDSVKEKARKAVGSGHLVLVGRICYLRPLITYKRASPNDSEGVV